ncbi:MAG: hypothetical protein HKP58_08780 [Desulfatitalea sp.]|nr:hypothetical protein [Desulfatitalea sp.]NNK00493.1 hypothetical protein [Desulfatitalea sp.]
MDIIIKETGEVEELRIIDRKNGVNWAGDLVGNHTIDADCEEDEDGIMIMDLRTHQWWDNLTTTLQAAEDRFWEMIKDIPGSECEPGTPYHELMEQFNERDGDLEDQPSLIHAICDGYQNR